MRRKQHVSRAGQEEKMCDHITENARRFGGRVKLSMELRSLRKSLLLDLSDTSRGRMVLHILALRRNGNFRWHLAGVFRELRSLP